MEEKEMVTIKNNDITMQVELVTYLISDDNNKKYIVYSKGEKTEVDSDEVIYVAELVQDGEIKETKIIDNDDEWVKVQELLKNIANAGVVR